MSAQNEPPLFVPNAGLERQRSFEAKLRADLSGREYLSWRFLPYLLATAVGMFVLLHWSTIRAPAWKPPEPSRWEHFSGVLQSGYRSYVLVLNDQEWVPLYCAPNLHTPWSCSSGYQAWTEKYAGQPVNVALAINKELWGAQAIVVEARGSDAYVHGHKQLRMSADEAVANLLGVAWIYGAVIAFYVIGMVVRSADERRVASNG